MDAPLTGQFAYRIRLSSGVQSKQRISDLLNDNAQCIQQGGVAQRTVKPRRTFCVDELGFDACIDYKVAGLAERLAAAVPDGIDIYFENVGGDVLEAVIPLLNDGCRVPVCGYIAHYNLTEGEARPTPPQRLRAAGLATLGEGGRTDGFRFFAFTELATQHPAAEEALAEMSGWIHEGRLKYRESVTDGLESSIGAFIGMLRGENFGKTLVRAA